MAGRLPSPRSAELRPLGTAELLDAALEIARRDLGLYGGLAVLALGPLVLLALRFAVAKGGATPLDGAAHAGHAALLTLALLWRYVVMGASAIALDRHLAGERPRLGPCLRAALARGLSLAVAGALVLLLNVFLYFIFLANVWLGWFVLCAIPLCAERSATGFGSLGASRRTLAGLGGKAAALNALYLLLLALLLLNCMLGVHVLLVIGRALFDLDVAWVQRFLSPANPIFWLISLGVAVTLLEPLRHLTCALLLWDARIRREAHDIRAVFAELGRAAAAQPRPKSGVAALVLCAALGIAAPARAAGDDAADLGRRLVALEQQARILAEPGSRESKHHSSQTGRQSQRLPATEQQKLARFLDEGEASLARLQRLPPGDARAHEATQLARRADGVIVSVGRLADRPAARDARGVAREVLAQPEFQVRPRGEVKPRVEETWFDRLLRKLFKRRGSPRSVSVGTPGLGGAFFKALTTVLLVTGAAIILILVVQWLWRRRRHDADQPRAPAGDGEDLAAPLPDPTKRSAAEWLADADAAAAAGDFRRAVRALYLALLSALCRRGVLRYDPARTNGEYARSYRGPDEDRAVFRRVTLISDAAIYGDFAPRADDYGHARELAIRLAAEGPPA